MSASTPTRRQGWTDPLACNTSGNWRGSSRCVGLKEWRQSLGTEEMWRAGRSNQRAASRVFMQRSWFRKCAMVIRGVLDARWMTQWACAARRQTAKDTSGAGGGAAAGGRAGRGRAAALLQVSRRFDRLQQSGSRKGSRKAGLTRVGPARSGPGVRNRAAPISPRALRRRSSSRRSAGLVSQGVVSNIRPLSSPTTPLRPMASAARFA